MKKKFLTIAFLTSVFAISCDQISNTSSNKDVKAVEIVSGHEDQAADAASSKLGFLKELNGKYPMEVKLFDNAAFTQRLKKLLGDRYDFLKTTWAVETPIEFNHNVFKASACQAHNCPATNFIVVYDFGNDVMYAGIKEENVIKTYSENGKNIAEIEQWVKLD